MDGDVNVIRKRTGFRWVRSDSGATYLCPEEDTDLYGGAPDELLRRECVDESLNPHI